MDQVQFYPHQNTIFKMSHYIQQIYRLYIKTPSVKVRKMSAKYKNEGTHVLTFQLVFAPTEISQLRCF